MQRQLCKAACNIALSLWIAATARTCEHLTAAAAQFVRPRLAFSAYPSEMTPGHLSPPSSCGSSSDDQSEVSLPFG